MTIQPIAGLKLVGQSTDAKPTTLDSEQWTFLERDTGHKWIWDGTKWVDDGFTVEVERTEGSPLIRLTGDEFATTAETSLYLLGSDASAISGTALTDNGTIVPAIDNDLPMRGHLVSPLNGSSQYWSLPTEASVQVGTDSFMASIWFKTTDSTTAMRMFQYGSAQGQYWRINKNADKTISIEIDDDSNVSLVSSGLVPEYYDNRWHCAVMIVDRTNNIMKLLVDGKIIASGSTSVTTRTLDGADNLYIGASKNASGTIVQHWNGSLANFHLIKMTPTASATGTVTCASVLAGDTVTVNGLLYTAVAGAKSGNTQFSIDTSDTACATDLADSITNDARTPVTIPSIDQTATSSIGVVTITATIGAGGNKIDLSSSNGTRLAVSGAFLTGGKDYSDYNAVKVLNQGIRESVVSGTWVLEANSTFRLNSRFKNTSTTNGDYLTTVIDVEDGEYDFQVVRDSDTNRGIVSLDVDGVTVATNDNYAGSGGQNLLDETFGIKLSSGKHILKFKLDGTNGSSTSPFYWSVTNFINIIKRNGHENGGADEFLILGDEMNIGSFTGSAPSNLATAHYNNLDTRIQTNEFAEGVLFLRGGKWKITFSYRQLATSGNIDLDIGGTKVIDDLKMTGATLDNQLVNTTVILSQGKNLVRYSSNAVTSQYHFIKGVRLSE